MTTALGSWGRFSLVTVLLAGTGLMIHARKQVEIIPSYKNLDEFPKVVGSLQGQDLPLSADVRQSLGPGEFLFRDYAAPKQARGVNLFVAYFPSQRTGDTIHSPKNCLPAEGWSPLESKQIWIENPDGAKVAVNRYLVQDDDDRAVVLYWYQAHGRVTSNEYWAKFYLVADSIRMARSDGAMIRIFAPVDGQDDADAAERRAVQFAQQIWPVLDEYVPR
jgi:EpsI family protein